MGFGTFQYDGTIDGRVPFGTIEIDTWDGGINDRIDPHGDLFPIKPAEPVDVAYPWERGNYDGSFRASDIAAANPEMGWWDRLSLWVDGWTQPVPASKDHAGPKAIRTGIGNTVGKVSDVAAGGEADPIKAIRSFFDRLADAIKTYAPWALVAGMFVVMLLVILTALRR